MEIGVPSFRLESDDGSSDVIIISEDEVGFPIVGCIVRDASLGGSVRRNSLGVSDDGSFADDGTSVGKGILVVVVIVLVGVDEDDTGGVDIGMTVVDPGCSDGDADASSSGDWVSSPQSDGSAEG